MSPRQSLVAAWRPVILSCLCAFIVWLSYVLAMPARELDAVFFNADTLYIPGLFRDLFVDGYELSGWKLTPAPYFFPDMPLYASLRVTFGSISLAVLGVSLVQFVGIPLGVGLAWAELERFVGQASGQRTAQRISNRNVVGRCLLVWVLVFGANVGFDLLIRADLSGPMVFRWFGDLFISGAHGGAALVAGFAWFAWLRFRRQGSVRVAVVLVLAGALTLASDRLFLLLFPLPALGLLLVERVGGRALQLPTLARPGTAFAVLCALVAGGLALESWVLGRNWFLVPPAFSSPLHKLVLTSAYWSNVVHATKGFVLFFAVPLGLGLGGLVCVFCMPSLRRGAQRVVLITLLGLCGLGLLAAALSGEVVPRYAMWSALVVCLAGAGAISSAVRPWLDSIASARWLHVLPVTASLVLLLAALLNHWPQSPPLAGHKPGPARCIDQAAKHLPLRAGIASYQLARPATLYNARGIRVNPVAANLEARYWINNYLHFFGRDRSPAYNFVLTEGLPAAEIRARFGRPDRSVGCPGSGQLLFFARRDAPIGKHLQFTRKQVQLWRQLTGR